MHTHGNPAITRSRNLGIDGLRGLAVLMVVASHISGSAAGDLGPAGVAVFFVLSGYLITGVLLRERWQFGNVRMLDFYGRRTVRLFPALLAVILATPLLLWAFADPRLSRAPLNLLATVTYIQDFTNALGQSAVLGHTWSLAVEEQFYLIWPAILLFLCRRRSNLTRTISVFATLFLTWHLLLALAGAGSWAYFMPDGNTGFLLLGASLAAGRAQGSLELIPAWSVNVALGTLLLAPIVTSHFPDEAWRGRNLVTMLAAGCAVLAIVGAQYCWLLNLRLLRWFGTISYGLYLWDWALTDIWPGGVPLAGLQRLAAACLATLAAAASWYLLEQRMQNRFRHRFLRLHIQPPVVPDPTPHPRPSTAVSDAT